MSDVKLSKLGVAKRQLCTAIDLYFSDGDLVSAWTLGAAAYNVIRDLKKASGESNMMLKDQIVALVPPERRQSVFLKIQEVENFLKHADRDPKGTLTFSPHGRIELLLFDAANVYREQAGSETPEMVLIRMWFLTNAIIEFDGDDGSMQRWMELICKKTCESPAAYRSRLWSEAVRVAVASRKPVGLLSTCHQR